MMRWITFTPCTLTMLNAIFQGLHTLQGPALFEALQTVNGHMCGVTMCPSSTSQTYHKYELFLR